MEYDKDKKFSKWFEKICEEYPEYTQRLINRANWQTQMFSKVYNFLKKLALEQEFKKTLTAEELQVFSIMEIKKF